MRPKALCLACAPELYSVTTSFHQGSFDQQEVPMVSKAALVANDSFNIIQPHFENRYTVNFDVC